MNGGVGQFHTGFILVLLVPVGLDGLVFLVWEGHDNLVGLPGSLPYRVEAPPGCEEAEKALTVRVLG